MHAKEKHLHRLYGKEEIARDGASIYCFYYILEVWQSWSIAPVLKTGGRLTPARGFESLSFRIIEFNYVMN